MPARDSIGGLLLMAVLSMLGFMGLFWLIGRRGTLAERSPLRGPCKKCGVPSELVRDMANPYSNERLNAPSVCLGCWRGTHLSTMKAWYRDAVVVALVFVLPAFTVAFWLLWSLYLRYQPHEGDGKRGLHLCLLLPTILLTAFVPAAWVRWRLTCRYGPQLETLSRPNREALEPIHIAVWFLLSVVGLVVFYLWDKKMNVTWW